MLKTKPKFTHNPYFKFLASIRFAIPALFAFAAAMIYGTFSESANGTEYVRHAVYHTWWFYLIQLSIAASITLSVIDRIPFRKRLTGFYVVHASLLTLMLGAVVTKVWGVDGSIQLSPNSPASSIQLPESMLYLTDGRSQYAAELPSSSKPVRLGSAIKFADGSVVTPLQYVPFAGLRNEWRPLPGAWSSEWNIKTPQFAQKIELVQSVSALPQADLGPLHIEVVPSQLFTILETVLPKADAYPYVVYNARTGHLEPVPAFSAEVQLRKSDKFDGGMIRRISHGGTEMALYRLETGGQTYNFIPEFSPFPVKDGMNLDETADYRFVSFEHLRARSTVLLSRFSSASPVGRDGIRIAYGKGASWTFSQYEGKPFQLPWMGIELAFLSEKKDQIAEAVLGEVKPNKEEQKNMKAVMVRLTAGNRSEDLWMTNRNESRFELGAVQGYISGREVPLPFSMTLERFKMDQIPGTDKPASYESFVKVKEGDRENTVHIFMNHPFKADGYTFYQSSYFQDDSGQYHSVLSVNKDPGRPIKYFGSALLVVGLILHFMIIYGYVRFREVSA